MPMESIRPLHWGQRRRFILNMEQALNMEQTLKTKPLPVGWKLTGKDV